MPLREENIGFSSWENIMLAAMQEQISTTKLDLLEAKGQHAEELAALRGEIRDLRITVGVESDMLRKTDEIVYKLADALGTINRTFSITQESLKNLVSIVVECIKGIHELRSSKIDHLQRKGFDDEIGNN